MADLKDRIKNLSPEQKALLEKKLREKAIKKAAEDKITVRKNVNEYPMSSAQERLWFLHQLNPNSGFYNIPAAIKIVGELNIDALKKSLSFVIDRHQILNVIFNVENNHPVQKLKKFNLNISVEDITGRMIEINKIINDEAEKPFNIEEGPLYRIKLLKFSNTEYILLLTLHHIVADGWSVGILINELSQNYDSFSKNNDSPFSKLPIQYFDYANWRNSFYKKEDEVRELKFWTDKLSGMPQSLELPYDRVRPATQTFKGDRHYFEIPSELAESIKKIGQQNGASPFMTFLSVLQILLYKYSNQNDFGIGTLVSDRQRSETKDLLGFFVNTLVMRTEIDKERSFNELLNDVKNYSLSAFQHQYLPFEKVVENLLEERSSSISPLFQVMFDFQETPFKKLNLPGISLEVVELEMQIAKFELLLILEDSPDGITGMFEFSTDIFDKKTIKRFANSYLELLKNIIDEPEQSIDKLSIINKEQQQILIKKLNTVVAEYPQEFCIHQLFEKQAELVPENIAVEFNNRKITYSELNEKSNQLAKYLISKGVKNDELVAIHLERNENLVISILAVLKVGGAYLPMDPIYPKDRLEFMLKDSKVKILITENEFENKFISNSFETIIIDRNNSEIEKENPDNVKVKVSPKQTAYVIYTSGSTGKPKGTLISHYNIVRLFQSSEKIFQFNSNDVWTLFHSYSFDFSVWEIWGALIYGGKLIVVPSDIAKSPAEFYNLLKQKKVTVLNQTPTAFYQLNNEEESKTKEKLVSSLRYVVFGGEALDFNQLKPWFEKHGYDEPKLINMYGITETTVHVTYKVISGDDIKNSKSSNIGIPLPDLQLYILDENLRPQQIGVPGEICVGGAGLAKGYLFRDDLTNQKFINHPFEQSKKLYRSGDLGRFLDNGEVEYLGRIDKQVKLRGFRIELGEIENVLSSLPEIKKAIVLLHGDTDITKKLIAFYIPSEKSIVKAAKLKKDISILLPDYMIPASLIEIESVPLTGNGKLDAKTLLAKVEQTENIKSENYVAPRNDLEKLLIKNLEDILKKKNIGIHDNFFNLGGNSIQAAVLANNLQKEFNETFHVGTIFFAPTIYEVAKHFTDYFPEKLKEKFSEDIIDFYETEFEEESTTNINKEKINKFTELLTKLSPRNERDFKTHKNKKAVFILSSPRSGSTLLRVMLNGNSSLFSPPELELMAFSTFKERGNTFVGEHEALKDGLTRAIIELQNLSEGEALRFLKHFEDKDLTIKETYNEIQRLLNNKILVDKTPIYSLDQEILKRIEEDFDDVLFIHLIRHPYAVIHSFVEAKMETYAFRKKMPFTLEELAELVWLKSNSNIENFLTEIPKQRKYQLKFSNLVLNPEKIMREVSEFIGVEYSSEMLNPYSGEKMTDGIKENVPMVGDLKFYLHKKINHEVLTKWKQHHKGNFLGTETKKLAEKYNFNIIDIDGQVNSEKVKLFRSYIPKTDFNISENNSNKNKRAIFILSPPRSGSTLLRVMMEGHSKLFSPPELQLLSFNNLIERKEKLSGNYDLWSGATIRAIMELKNCSSDEAEKIINKFEEENLSIKDFYAKLQDWAGDKIIVDKTPTYSLDINTLMKAEEYFKDALYIHLTRHPYASIHSYVDAKFDKLFFQFQHPFTSREVAEMIWMESHKNILTFLGKVPDERKFQVKFEDIVTKPEDSMKNLIQFIGLDYDENLIDPYNSTRMTDATQKGTQIIGDHKFYLRNKIDANVIELWKKYHKRNYLNEEAKQVAKALSYNLDEDEKHFVSPRTYKLSDSKIEKFENIILPISSSKKVIRKKIPRTVFILSPPRSGSTLLRVMLEGHDKLFSPPELDLLTFNTLGERKQKLQGKYSLWLEATIRAIMELKNCSSDEASKIMNELEDKNIHVSEFYSLLNEWSDNKILIDKTPTYSLDINVLERAEEYFDKPLYIHLVRNPYASIYSSEKADIQGTFFRFENEFTNRELSELVWLKCHENTLKFLKDIPNERQIKLKFEDIVTNPEREMKVLSNYLGIEYQVDLITPYDGKRMTDPIKENSQMVGDFKFYVRNKIDPKVNTRWKKNHKIDFLCHRSLNIAYNLGYTKDDVIITDMKSTDEEYSTIIRTARSKDLPLSFAQQRLWFLEQLEPGKTTYNIPGVVRAEGDFDIEILEQSINLIIKRHEALRTIFTAEDGKAKQIILDEVKIEINRNDLTEISKIKIEDETKRLIVKLSAKPFNLEKGPLLRVELIKIAKNDNYLLITMHHIISDGWSSEIFIKELSVIYSSLIHGKKLFLQDLKIQYVDFAAWQRNILQSDDYNKQLDYWKNKLGGSTPLLKLPNDFTRPSVQSKKGQRLQFEINETIIEKVNEISINESTTVYTIFLAAFNLLLKVYSNSNDIPIGTPIAGRTRKEIEPLIGFFVNTLVLRNDLSNDPTFLELLERVKKVFSEAINNQDIPFEKLVDELQVERSLSYSPLFQVMFVFNNSPFTNIKLEGLTLTPKALDLGAAKFDITLVLTKRNNRIRGSIEFNKDIFTEDTMQIFIEHYQNILTSVIDNPKQKISEVKVLNADERKLLISNIGKLENTWKNYKSIVEIISKKSKELSEKIALVFEEKKVTYSQLEKISNQLANYLLQQGVKQEELVAICIDRSIEMMYGLLGILKAGAAYLPIDPSNPEDRIHYIIENSNVKILLTNSESKPNIIPENTKVILLDDIATTLLDVPVNNLRVQTDIENTMYCIYTSGSTGLPKGTLVTNKGVVNRLLWMQKEYSINETDVILQKTPYTFDVSVWELFLALMSGGTLVIAKPGGHKDSNYLKDIINEHNVTIIHFVPPMLQVFLEEENLQDNCKSLKRVICSGEALGYNLQTKFYKKFNEIELHNLYGPTEASIDVSYWACDSNNDLQTVPIGKPIWNTSLYILDNNLNPVPKGVAGELYISGISLARGYLNRTDLTAEKFIPDPFCSIPNSRMYKTGDSVKLLPNGSIEYLERLDNQVKIRGFRIELGEIEKVLNENELINKALVATFANEIGGKKLVAYLLSDKIKLPINKVREYLSKSLPDYMIPSVFVYLDEFPLTTNGKINRKALPKPELSRDDIATEFIAPSTEKEIILANIWKELLKLDKVGIEDNFFELGGDSILGIQVIAKANQAGVGLTPKDLFLYPHIKGLAATAKDSVKIHAEQELLSGEAELLPIQKWFFEQKLVNPNHWNQSLMLEVKEPLDVEILRDTIEKIVEHHDILRMKYIVEGDKTIQQYSKEINELPLEIIDLSKYKSNNVDDKISKKAIDIQATLNINDGKVFKCAYFNLGINIPGRLLLVAHHLVIDGVSWRILTEHLLTIYGQFKNGTKLFIPSKTTSFGYWSKNISKLSNSKMILEQIDYWKSLKLLQDTIKTDVIDTSKNIERTTDRVSISLNEKLTESLLQEVPKIYNTEINDILLTALLLANSRWKGSRRMSVSLEGHGREPLFDDIDISGTVGWFTTLFPIVLDLKDSITPIDSIKVIKEQIRAIPNNGIGYGILKYVSNKDIKSDLPHLAEISFNYLGQYNQILSDEGTFAVAKDNKGRERAEENLRPFVIDIIGSVFNSRLQMSWIYNENIHSKEDILDFAELYKDELTKIIEAIKSDKGGYTPSDFKEVKLDDEELDTIFSELDEDFEDE